MTYQTIALIIGIGLILCYIMIYSEDKPLKKQMPKDQKRAENEAWVNQLIANIKDEDNELAY